MEGDKNIIKQRIFHLFPEPFLLMMLLLVTFVILLTPLTIILLLIILLPKKTKESINYSHRQYSDYLNDKCKNSFFIYPADKDEIADIISSLVKNKSIGPYSAPHNIILLKNEISNPLADLFNLSFSSGIFPLVLKIAKVLLAY